MCRYIAKNENFPKSLSTSSSRGRDPNSEIALKGLKTWSQLPKEARALVGIFTLLGSTWLPLEEPWLMKSSDEQRMSSEPKSKPLIPQLPRSDGPDAMAGAWDWCFFFWWVEIDVDAEVKKELCGRNRNLWSRESCVDVT